MFAEENLIYIVGSAVGVILCLVGTANAIGYRSGANRVLKYLDIRDAVTGEPLWENANSFFKDCPKGYIPAELYHRIAFAKNDGYCTIHIAGTRLQLHDVPPIPAGIFKERGYYILAARDLKNLLIAAGVPQS